jgi:hypothetical protein
MLFYRTLPGGVKVLEARPPKQLANWYDVTEIYSGSLNVNVPILHVNTVWHLRISENGGAKRTGAGISRSAFLAGGASASVPNKKGCIGCITGKHLYVMFPRPSAFIFNAFGALWTCRRQPGSLLPFERRQ